MWLGGDKPQKGMGISAKGVYRLGGLEDDHVFASIQLLDLLKLLDDSRPDSLWIVPDFTQEARKADIENGLVTIVGDVVPFLVAILEAAFDGAEDTQPAGEVEEDDGIGRLESNVERPAIGPINDPLLASHQVGYNSHALRFRRLFPSWAPKEAVEMDDGQVQVMAQLLG